MKSVVLFFRKPNVEAAANGAGIGANALNTVSNNTTDTVIGTAQTAQSVWATVQSGSKFAGAAGGPISAAAGYRAVEALRPDWNEERRVIEYLLSPIEKAGRESLRER